MSSRKPVPFTPEEIVTRFEAGEGRLDLTKRYRVRVAAIDAALATAGYEKPQRASRRGLPKPVPNIDVPELVRRYEAGESENALAKHFGCSRNVLRRHLLANSVTPRGRHEAMLQRQDELSPEERQALAEAAHVAVRGRTATEEERVKRAATIGNAPNRWTSPYELELDRMLRDRGYEAALQMPLGRYNIDLAFEPLAVEVHRYSGHPMTYVEQRPRVDYLAERGWSTLYVWLNLRQPMTEAVAETVATEIERFRADPSGYGKVRTIRLRPTGRTEVC